MYNTIIYQLYSFVKNYNIPSTLFSSETGDVTVYIWLPHGLGITRVGHASMELPDGTYISWWPENKSKKSKAGANSIATTAVLHDSLAEDIEEEEGELPLKFVIPGLNVARIKAWWNENKYGTYM